METQTTELDISKIQYLDFDFEIEEDGFEITTKEEGEQERIMTAIISSAAVDRVGDRVMPGAFVNLGKDGKTTPLLWAHDRNSMPLAKSLWMKNDRRNKTVIGKFVFRNNPASIDAYDMVKEGFITKVSVGFNVLKDGWEQNDFNGYDITKAEILEVSLVNIPANRDAIIQGVKSMMDDGYKFSKSSLKEFELMEIEIINEDAEEVEETQDEVVEEEPTLRDVQYFRNKLCRAFEKEPVGTMDELMNLNEAFVLNMKVQLKHVLGKLLTKTPDQSVVEESGEDAAISDGDEVIVEKSDPATATSDGDEQGIIIVED